MGIVNYLNLLTAIIGKRFIYAHFGLTHRCNIHCRMCGIWRLGEKNQELTLEQIKILAGTLKRIGIVVISLGGGEPFLREDLREIIKIFIQRNFVVRLLTNATLVKKDILEDLLSAGLRNISVSLDTLSAKKQSFICNQDGIWDKIVGNMILISKLFPKRGCHLLVNTTVSGLNLEELPSLAKFVGELGYCISYIPLEPVSVRHCGLYCDDYPEEFKITPEDHKAVDEVYDKLIKMKRDNNNNIFNSVRFLENSRQFLKTAQKDWKCDAGKLYLSVDPQGNFSICHRFPPEAPYLDRGLRSLLKSKQFQIKRERLIKDCHGCMRPCWAEITYLVKDNKSLWEMMKLQMFVRKGERAGFPAELIQGKGEL